MELSEVLRRRRMVRAYDPDRPVPAEKLDAVCAAALRAPSAGFTQGVSLVVLDRERDVARFWALRQRAAAPGCAGMRTAPVLIMVWTSEQAYLDRYAEPDKGWTDRDPGRWSAPYWYVDGGMAAMAALLAAVDAGLGACFFGIPAERIGAVRSAYARSGRPAQRRRDQPGLSGAGTGPRLTRPATATPPERLIHHGSWTRAESPATVQRLARVARAVMIP